MKPLIVCAVALCLSVAIVVACILLAVRQRRRQLMGRHVSLRPFWAIVGGVFLAGIALSFPLYLLAYFQDSGFSVVFKSLWMSVFNTMRLFLLNADFDPIRDLLASVHSQALSVVYSIYACILYVVAPILTAGFVLSLFKSATAQIAYALHPATDTYYMSELNEQSLLLAEDIMHNTPEQRKTVVFLSVNLTDENSEERIMRAKRIGAICLPKDITEIKLKTRKKDVLRKLYFISETADKNLEQALQIIHKCRLDERYNNSNTEFYVFSTSPESESLLNTADNDKMKVRRVNESRNLIFNTLYTENVQTDSIFADAIDGEHGKDLNIVIVGLGRYGTELFKALCWIGQMRGYSLTLHIFDKAKNVEEKIGGIAPELLKRNGIREAGESYCKIFCHPGIDAKELPFIKKLQEIGNVTTAFALMGEDEMNLDAAIRMREIFGQLHHERKYTIPTIYAAVTSPAKNETIEKSGGIKSFEGVDYGIKLIGNAKTEFSKAVIEQTDLEDLGLECHLQWATTTEDEEKERAKYYKYEYYRRSSIAEALYAKLRVKLGILTGGSAEEDRQIRINEHCRWNAYMRTEGYVHIPDTKPERDHIAKVHFNLVPDKRLTKADQDKDTVVIAATQEKMK